MAQNPAHTPSSSSNGAQTDISFGYNTGTSGPSETKLLRDAPIPGAPKTTPSKAQTAAHFRGGESKVRWVRQLPCCGCGFHDKPVHARIVEGGGLAPVCTVCDALTLAFPEYINHDRLATAARVVDQLWARRTSSRPEVQE